jgi:hypothetical protein
MSVLLHTLSADSYLVSPALACGRLLELSCPPTSTLPMSSLLLPYSFPSPSFFRRASFPRAVFGCFLLCLTIPLRLPPSYLHFLSSPGIHSSPGLARVPSRASGDTTWKNDIPNHRRGRNTNTPCIHGETVRQYRVTGRANASCHRMSARRSRTRADKIRSLISHSE